MPNVLSQLKIHETSLVDRPANSETDPTTGKRTPRATIALWKRDVAKGVKYLVSGGEAGDHLPYTGPDGKPDHRLMGAAWAALHEGYRGNKYEGPGKAEAIAQLKRIYAQEQMDLPVGKGDSPKGEQMDLNEIIKRQEAQDGLLATMKKDQDALKAENAQLAVLAKMSDKEKAAFGAMSKEKQKEYMDADGDEKKRMMAEACKSEDPKPGDPALKALEDRIGKAEKEANAAIVASNARVAKAEADLAEVKKAARLERFTKMAEEALPYTSGAPVEKGQTLIDLADAFGGEQDPRFVKAFGALKSADAALAIQFKAQGVYGGGTVRKAGNELEAAVKAIAKRDNITEGQAWIKASEEHADLWKRADEEKRSLASR